jgi:hypothetical protein
MARCALAALALAEKEQTDGGAGAKMKTTATLGTATN